jgi:hypothetical protein
MFILSDKQIKTLKGNTFNPMHHAVVVYSEILSVNCKLVSFKSELQNTALQPGQQLFIAARDQVTIQGTLSHIDKDKQLYSILLFLDNNNAHNALVVDIAPGDNLQFTLGEGKLYYNNKATHHFFFGDETAIGLFNAFKQVALENDHEYFGIMELQPYNEPVLNRLLLLIDSVPALHGQVSRAAITWMEDMHPNCWKAWHKATFYLAGAAALVMPFKQYLLQRQVPESRIRVAVC